MLIIRPQLRSPHMVVCKGSLPQQVSQLVICPVPIPIKGWWYFFHNYQTTTMVKEGEVMVFRNIVGNLRKLHRRNSGLIIPGSTVLKGVFLFWMIGNHWSFHTMYHKTRHVLLGGDGEHHPGLNMIPCLTRTFSHLKRDGCWNTMFSFGARHIFRGELL